LYYTYSRHFKNPISWKFFTSLNIPLGFISKEIELFFFFFFFFFIYLFISSLILCFIIDMDASFLFIFSLDLIIFWATVVSDWLSWNMLSGFYRLLVILNVILIELSKKMEFLLNIIINLRWIVRILIVIWRNITRIMGNYGIIWNATWSIKLLMVWLFLSVRWNQVNYWKFYFRVCVGNFENLYFFYCHYLIKKNFFFFIFF